MPEDISHAEIYERTARVEGKVGELTSQIAVINTRLDTTADGIDRNYQHFQKRVDELARASADTKLSLTEHRAEFKTTTKILAGMLVIGISGLGILVTV